MTTKIYNFDENRPLTATPAPESTPTAKSATLEPGSASKRAPKVRPADLKASEMKEKATHYTKTMNKTKQAIFIRRKLRKCLDQTHF